MKKSLAPLIYELNKIGSFNLLAAFSWGPTGAFRYITQQCPYTYHVHSKNLMLLFALIVSWLCCAWIDSLIWKQHNTTQQVQNSRLTFRNLWISLPFFIMGLGLIAIKDKAHWYFMISAIIIIIVLISLKHWDHVLPQLRKSFKLFFLIYALLLLGPVNLIAHNSIGAVECLSSSSVISNMNRFQSSLIQYYENHQQTCPLKWFEIQKESYWHPLQNPVDFSAPGIIQHPEHLNQQGRPFIEPFGIRIFLHRHHAGSVSYQYLDPKHCRVYGFDQNGNLIQAKGLNFYLTID